MHFDDKDDGGTLLSIPKIYKYIKSKEKIFKFKFKLNQTKQVV